MIFHRKFHALIFVPLIAACSFFDSPSEDKDNRNKSTTVSNSGSERVELGAGEQAKVVASSTGKLAGTTVEIPAGSLAVKTEIEIEELLMVQM